jgi:hypothetical protein
MTARAVFLFWAGVSPPFREKKGLRRFFSLGGVCRLLFFCRREKNNLFAR